MAEASIIIVEDELIVAKDIESNLLELGYDVLAVVSSGDDAIGKIDALRPDLILMDIILRGDMDGIDAAEIVKKRFDIPIVFLTAHADDATLLRVKTMKPFGYMIKPFDDKELHTVIEVALYRHQIEKQLKEKEQRFMAIFNCMAEGVITIDSKHSVTFMNAVAETMTGRTLGESFGKEFNEVLNLIDEKTLIRLENPANWLTAEAAAGSINEAILISLDGTQYPIDLSVATIKNQAGESAGVVLVFRNISERKFLEEKLHFSKKMEALGILASDTARELNNPLMIVLAMCEVVLKKLGSDSPLLEHMKEIKKAGERAASIAQNLLALGRKWDTRS